MELSQPQDQHRILCRFPSLEKIEPYTPKCNLQADLCLGAASAEAKNTVKTKLRSTSEHARQSSPFSPTNRQAEERS